MLNSRRSFLKNSTLVSLGFLGLHHFAAKANSAAYSHDLRAFGPLVNSDNGILRLPKGFTCKAISHQGDKMTDGFLTPGKFDGMGVFRGKDGKVLMVRNHELLPGENQNGPFGLNNELLKKSHAKQFFDFGKGELPCLGGTTTMVYNEQTQQVEVQYLSLVGTVRNCAGGITPWNSWVTCEETELGVGDEQGRIEKNHGYNFEVPASGSVTPAIPHPLKAMGRFVHEAIAVDPKTGIVYETEDSGDGIFYRFIPNTPGQLHKGGKLQCLSIPEWQKADTRNWETLDTEFPANKTFDVAWIDLDDVEAPENDLRLRGYDKGATRFARAEGIWYGKNELYFACTSGGKNAKGQIFRYTPGKFEGRPNEKDAPGKLELFLEPNNVDTFQSADNLTVAPWGDVVICEDKHDPRIIGITPQGQTYEIAKNIGYPKSEFAGPVFSPSGKTLFINIQSPGVTLAITGPWGKKMAIDPKA